jgi:hypothetical protein
MTQTSTIQIKDPKAPASEKQIGFLKTLTAERDLPETCQKVQLALTLGVLTKGNASQFIGELLKAPKKAATAAAPVAAAPVVPVVAEVVAEIVAELPAWGYYDIDGVIYHWGVTSKDAYPTLRRLHVVTNYDGTKKGSWKKAYIKWDPKMQVEATWLPYAGKVTYKTEVTKKVTVPAQLVGKTPMTLDEAKAKGKAFTFCVKCGATLTDPVSVANGIGPVCIKAFV